MDFHLPGHAPPQLLNNAAHEREKHHRVHVFMHKETTIDLTVVLGRMINYPPVFLLKMGPCVLQSSTGDVKCCKLVA